MSNTANLTADNNAGSIVNQNFGNIFNSIDQHPQPDQLQATLDALYVTDAPADRARKGDPVEGTCDRIEECSPYCSWRDSGVGSLWIKGGPDMVKTMLAVHLTERLETLLRKQNSAYAYFFCDHSDSNRNSACAIVRTLLAQIIEQQPALVNVARRCIGSKDDEKAEKRAQHTLASRDALWLILEDAIKLTNFPRVISVIDGLDECDTDSKQWIAWKIGSLPKNLASSTGTKVQFLVLSRHVIHLEDIPRIDLNKLSLADYSLGNSKFIGTRLQEVKRAVQGFEDKHQSTVQIDLENRCEGSFLWVGCVIEELRRKETCTEVLECLKNLPQGLVPLYDRILSQIEVNHHVDCAQILRWVAQVARPLTVYELSEALGINGSELMSQVQLAHDKVYHCRSLLRLEEHGDFPDVSTSTVVLVHYSFKEYLRDARANIDTSFASLFSGVEESHLYIAKRCVAYLQSTRRRERYWDCEDRRSREHHPLTAYATTYWPFHTRLAGSQVLELMYEQREFFDKGGLAYTGWWWSYRCVLNVGNVRTHLPRLVQHSSNTREQETIPPTQLAAALGILPWLQDIFDKNAGVANLVTMTNVIDELGQTPLHHATHRGQRDATVFLLEKGATIDDRAVFAAATEGHVEILDILLERGGNCNARAFDMLGIGKQETALWEAAHLGYHDIASVLLRYHANVDLLAPQKGLGLIGLCFTMPSTAFVAACFEAVFS